VILFGLELLIAGDIIRTVATSPMLPAAAVLALIVLVRTRLSIALKLEVERRRPWQPDATPAAVSPHERPGDRPAGGYEAGL
jgi:hypothetical protein